MAAPAEVAGGPDGQQEQAILQQQSFYPPVPPFYRLFRPDADGTAERRLPPAPPPPVEGTYQMFGELHTVPIKHVACRLGAQNQPLQQMAGPETCTLHPAHSPRGGQSLGCCLTPSKSYAVADSY